MFEVVVTVSDEASLLEGAERMRPGLAVLDLGLSREGLGVLRHLRERCPQQKVILLSLHDEPVVVEAAMRAGADGFVLKRTIAEDLLPAAEAVLAGGPYCSPSVSREGRSLVKEPS